MIYFNLNQKTYEWKIKRLLLFALLMTFFSNAFSQGTWTSLTNAAPNNNEGVMLLLTDGTVICKTDGGGGSGFVWNKLTPNASGSYQSGTWSSITSMTNDRRFFSSHVMKDGRVYVCGGEYGAGGYSGEIYNPVTNSWSATGSPGGSFISDANSEILESGLILQAIVSGNQCKLYNPTTNTYTTIASPAQNMNESTWYKLPDGTIIAIPTNSTQSMRYFPATNTWSNDGVLPANIYSDYGSEIGGAAMLPDGRIFFVGGKNATAIYTPSGTNAAGTWASGPAIPGNYGEPDGPAAAMRDGKVLFCGSPKPNGPDPSQIFMWPTRFYEYDYVANTITQVGAPGGGTDIADRTCYEITFLNLPNGQILCSKMGSTQYYLYTPAGSSQNSWKPTVSSYTHNCSTYKLYGTQFNGISLGSVYGDDWQMNTNYPIVRLSSGINVYYCKTTNWNSYLLRRGSSADTTDFSLPAGLPNGSYSLTVSANGIISNAFTFTTYPQLTTALSATTCSGSLFSYAPSFDRSCVSYSWTRAAVAGISNAAGSGNSSINETLINTTSLPVNVTYLFSTSHNGYSTIQSVVVTVNPTPSAISVTNNSICVGSSNSITASGASTYSWMPGFYSGSTVTITPSTVATYTVTGTNAYGCSNSTKVYASNPPTINTSPNMPEVCYGSTQALSATAVSADYDSLVTTYVTNNGSSANVFDVHTYNNITISKFRMNILAGTQAEIWYKASSYGNASVTSSAGWTKLGATVSITPAGSGVGTDIVPTVPLTIPAGSTYGIVVACNGSNNYINGSTVGSVFVANQDLYITEGHGGSAFGGTFNLINSPRKFSGEIIYTATVPMSAYSWSPASGLNSYVSSTPTFSGTSSTNYTVTITDAYGCSSSKLFPVYVNPNPSLLLGGTGTICNGNSYMLSVSGTSTETDSLKTTLNTNNGSAGNAFDVHANKNITITSVKMNISLGASQAEVWYKAGGYGNASLTSSVGWTKLGATVAITPLGAGSLTNIPLTASLSIPAGQTYGLVVVCNASNNYLNGTSVGAIYSQNPDMIIYEGHGGAGIGGTFSFPNAPRVFSGEIVYAVDNQISGYYWSPTANLNNPFMATPTASPSATTIYTVSVTDGNGCASTGTQKLNVNPKPTPVLAATALTPGCIGANQVISNLTTNYTAETDSLFTTLTTNNSNGGNAFDIITQPGKPVTITKFRGHLFSGTQAEVWYKAGGYGNTSFTGTTGWTKLGATITFTAGGSGVLTDLPITTPLIIPAGSTMGIMIVTNGTVNYLNGTSVGAVYSSNGDMAITQGHGGTGIGSYTFGASPRIWNGEVVYQVQNTFTTYSWTPTASVVTPGIINPTVNPTTSTIYTVNIVDINGCANTLSVPVYVYNNVTGSATALPATVCSGNSVVLNYIPPIGNQCYGAMTNLATPYAPANWTTSLVNSNGSVSFAAPTSMTIVGSNNNSGSLGTTSSTVTMACSGILSFHWSYTTTDGANYDYPRYTVNAGAAIIFPDYSNLGGPSQSGWFYLNVNAGDVINLQVYSVDNVAGAATVVIDNFAAPYQTSATQSVNWYNALTGGSYLGSGTTLNVPTSSSGSVTYYAEVYNNTYGCFQTPRVATNSVTVQPLPTVTATASPTVICSGASSTLTATGGATYSWQPGGMTGASVTVSPSSNTIYTVTATSTNGCTSTKIVRVDIYNNVAGTASASPSTICLGSPTTLNYTAPSGAACYGSIQYDFLNTYAAANWSTVLTNSNGTVTPTTTSVTITSGNNASNLTGTTSYAVTAPCSGNVVMHWNYTTVDGAVWDYPRYQINGGAAITFPGYNTAGSSTQSGDLILSVNAGDIVTLQMYTADNQGGAGTVVLSNFSAPYAASYTHSVQWYTAATAGTLLSSSNPATITPSLTGPQTFYAQVTNTGTGCVISPRIATNLVTVNALPSVSTTATNTTICSGNSASITASGASTYVWQPGALSGTTVTVSPATTTTYTVVGTGSNGCTATATRTITVNSASVSASSSAISICSGGTTILNASGASTYVWQPGALSGTSVSVAPTTTTTYTVTGTAANGCTATSTIIITVFPLPTVTVSATNTTICTGSSTTLTAGGASSYTWMPGSLSGTSVNVTPASTTTYTVTGVSVDGCASNTTITITVNTTPTVGTTVTNATICSGASTSITGTGASTYSWQPGALSGTTVTVSPTTTTTYTVTGTAANGCAATATRLITVNTTPTVGTTVTNATICSGASTSITGTGASTYSWQPGSLSGTTVTVSPTTTTTYTVTGTAANGCTATATRLITVNTTPTVGTTVTNATICSGASTSITGTGASTYSWQPGALSGTTVSVSPTTTTTYTVTGTAANGCTATATRLITVNTSPTVSTSATVLTINCTGSSTLSATGASTYAWQPGALTGSSVTVSPTVTTTYTVTGTAANGCTKTSTITITVNPCSGSTVNVKAYIQGYYLAGGVMTPTLNNQGLPNPVNQTDTVVVELHQATSPYATVQSYKGVLLTNGTIACSFPAAVIGNSYYIVVNGRNMLQTWSANPVLMAASVTYDFSTAQNKAYANNMIASGGVWTLHSGDINQDMAIDIFDYLLIEPDISAGNFGYLNTDLNGDGSVDSFDYLVMEDNIITGISAATP